MMIIGSWHSTPNGSVYTARASLDGREALVRLHVGVFEGLHLTQYTGDLGKVWVERAAQAAAATRVSHFSA